MQEIEEYLLKDNISELPLETKKSALIAYAYSVLRNPQHSQQLKNIRNKLSISEQEVVQAYLDYDLDVNGFGNEIYNSIRIRTVLHLHNLLMGSWHQERQNTILNIIKSINIKSAIDIGFGVPSKYIKEYILPIKSIKLTLCDFADTAFQFASALLSEWDPNWKKVINFKQEDMVNSKKIGGAYDAFIFQDSIEHVLNPTLCLQEYVQLAKKNSYFILSIPIGPKITSHYMAWDTDEDAILWLQQSGLNILSHQSIWINPKVDLFANKLGKNLHDIIILCRK